MESAIGKTQIVRCSECGANNRADAAKLAVHQAVCGRCQSPLSLSAKPIVVTDQNYAEQIENSPLPVLLDLWAAWCAPCRMIAPVIEQLAAELAGRVRVGKLDVDANQQTAARFGVRSIPTLLVLKDGHEVDRIVGSQPKEAILQHLQPHL